MVLRINVCVCVRVCVCVCVCIYIYMQGGVTCKLKKVNVWSRGVHTSVHLCMQSVNSDLKEWLLSALQ